MNHNTRMVVFDDDPTGIQTVHGCLLVTDWSEQNLITAFEDREPFFYVLTNSRALSAADARRVLTSAVEAVLDVNRRYGYRLIMVSRSDSCLRGHFPLETDVMRDVLREHGYNVWPRTPFCPAFIESGRVTIDGTHYMIDKSGTAATTCTVTTASGERLIPVSETEFARDNVFGYKNACLTEYIREKGGNPADYDIVNAQSYAELDSFRDKLFDEIADFDGAVVIRSSSSLPRSMSGISDKPYLTKQDLGIDTPATPGSTPATLGSTPATLGSTLATLGSTLATLGSTLGDSISENATPAANHPATALFIVGSHVKKTTAQLMQLLREPGIAPRELSITSILNDKAELLADVERFIMQCQQDGTTPVIYTAREEVRIDDPERRQHLGQEISDFLVSIVQNLPISPRYVVAKGGITSHDILTHGLNIKVGRVMGQAINSVPCVMAPPLHEGGSPIPYIIFPGNVGDEHSLAEIFKKLE